MSYDIFISYARRDGTPLAKKLVVGLRAAGFRVFWDQDSIPAGANWEQTLDEALASATHILVVLTPYSVKSEEVAAEWRPMLAKGKNVIPLMAVPCEIPRRLSMRQYIDFQEDAHYQVALTELVEAINATQNANNQLTLSGEELIQRGNAYYEAGQIALAIDDYLQAMSASRELHIKIQALRLLGKNRRVDTIPRLLDKLGEEHEADVQTEILETIRRIVELEDWQRTQPDIIQQIKPWLQTDTPEIRRQTIRILAYGGDADHVPDVVHLLLHDPADVVRQQAALALGRLQSEEAKIGLLEARSDPSVIVRHGVVMALGRYADPKLIPYLQAMILGDRSSRVRTAATESIMQIENRTR